MLDECFRSRDEPHFHRKNAKLVAGHEQILGEALILAHSSSASYLMASKSTKVSHRLIWCCKLDLSRCQLPAHGLIVSKQSFDLLANAKHPDAVQPSNINDLLHRNSFHTSYNMGHTLNCTALIPTFDHLSLNKLITFATR